MSPGKKKFMGSTLDLKGLKSSVAIGGQGADTYRSMFSDAFSINEADPISNGQLNINVILEKTERRGTIKNLNDEIDQDEPRSTVKRKTVRKSLFDDMGRKIANPIDFNQFRLDRMRDSFVSH